ncbi:MFS transporter [Paenibacillus contaminans]|uniref:MFS transporter n=1 Tax=Paenibacillus contaminans TaxID=450362 RepID=A0A329MKN4_9BACL|nr:MFS transporter [Paenibacillus contaminans]RAV19866.1 MFS transporter [Paenibacillus contaminans]
MEATIKKKIDKKVLRSPFVMQLLFIMFFVEFVKGALIITFLPVYMETVLGATGLVIGWTLAVQYIGDNLLRTPIGWFIDKIGYRVVMLAGLLSTFGSVGIIASTSNYYWIIAACALLGIGTAPLWPCVITGTTEIAGEESRGTIMSVVYMAWLGGVGLGPFVITYFMSGTYGTAFRLLIAMMVAVLLVGLFLPGHRKGVHGAERSKEEEPSKASHKQLPRMERIRRYLAEARSSMTLSPLMFPAMFAQTFALGLLTPVLTLYALNELQLTNSQFRFFLLAGGAVTVLFLIPVGKLVDRWGTKWFLHVGFLLSAIVLTAFTYVHELSSLFVLVALLGIGYALIIPSWNALIAAAIPPAKRGAVWGFFLTIEGLGTTIGPIVSGKLWDMFRPHGPFVASGIVLFLLWIVHIAISQERKVLLR